METVVTKVTVLEKFHITLSQDIVGYCYRSKLTSDLNS